MKKISFLLIVLAVLFVVPFTVFADEEENTEISNSNVVKVYFFRGEGCPHCQEAEEWFSSIEEEYGDYFDIVDYETWYNEDNAALMEKVEKVRGEEAGGVPYIIVGDKSWMGFAEEYEEGILDEIKNLYATDVSERYDVMQYVNTGTTAKAKKKSSTGGDVLATILIIIICCVVGFGIHKARNNTN